MSQTDIISLRKLSGQKYTAGVKTNHQVDTKIQLLHC
jgi:hypothetical protein